MTNTDETITQAQNSLEAAYTIIENMRHYDHEKWHAVNVKRHGDYLSDKDIEDIVGVYDIQYQEALTEHINDIINENNQSLYWQWIEYQKEQLNYDITDCGVCGIHKTLECITMSYSWAKHPIVFLGRSGGWACFQSDIDSLVDDLEAEMNYDDCDYEEVINMTTSLNQCIEEVNWLMDFIDKTNKALDFKDEIEFRVEEYHEELVDEYLQSIIAASLELANA